MNKKKVAKTTKKKSNKSGINKTNNYKSINIFLAILGILIFVMAVIIYKNYKNNQLVKEEINKDFSFFYIPDNYSVWGIDISKYQGNINWNEVVETNKDDNSISFVFIKSTEGLNLKDPNYRKNYIASRKKGIITGTYHFFNPMVDAKQQADFFLKNSYYQKGDLPPVIDIETGTNLPKKQIKQGLLKFIKQVESVLHVKPIIYTNADYYKLRLTPEFDNYPLWVAHYFEKERPEVNRKWHFWQYADNARIKGINHKVDVNVFNGELEDLHQLLKQ